MLNRLLFGPWMFASALALVAAVSALIWAVPVESADTTITANRLHAIIDGPHRAAEHKERDQYRHPAETLLWFGIRDDMTVVEVFPGGGWYTEILAPFLRERGTLYAAGYDADSKSRFFREGARQFKANLAAQPQLYDKVIVTELAPPVKVEIAPAGNADMVLTFRNVHNWMAGGYADQVFAAMYRALKPGGILGLVEHREDPAVPQDPSAPSGYVNEDYVIKLATEAGFELAGRSDINANPKDTKDYPKGVWTLPPTLRLGDKDRDKYLAIGESDRMTLKFLKPLDRSSQ